MKRYCDIEVVLPAFNGALYIKSQIQSIYNQTVRPKRLLVRDDGSTDGTISLLHSLIKQYGDWICLLPCDGNLGCCGNVNRLLENTVANYVALSDQDDIWHHDKIKISLDKMQRMEKLHGINAPLLVHSDLDLVDDSCKSLGVTFWQKQRLNPNSIDLDSLCVTNVVTGCTAVINRPLINKAIPIPPSALMHDWWLALVASTQGSIGAVMRPTVMYRQHQANIVGAKGIGIRSYLSKIIMPRSQRPLAVIRALALQADALSLRFSTQPPRLCIILTKPRFERLLLLVLDSSTRKDLRKHDKVRTILFYLLVCIA